MGSGQRHVSSALDEYVPDVILSDYSLPAFDGLAAMNMARQRFPEVPVIIVSGAIGEEVAIETLKNGATDYVLKGRLGRLAPAVRRAIQEVKQTAEKKKAEEALREREKELRLIMDSGPTLIAYVDSDCRYRRVNKACEEVLGVAADEVPGRSMRNVLGEAAWEVLRPHIERVLAGERVVFEAEVPLKKGGTRWVYATYTPDFDDSRRVRGFVVHSTDIGERKKAENELKALNEILEERVAIRSEELRRRAVQLRSLASELTLTEQRGSAAALRTAPRSPAATSVRCAAERYNPQAAGG